MVTNDDKREGPGWLSDAESRLVGELRHESERFKDCFLRHAFAGLGFATAAIPVIARFQADVPYVGFTSLLLVVLMLGLGRLGLYKYAGVNRNCGYELHLQRTWRRSSMTRNGWQPHMRTIGWEEALRAWRVVQATVFEFVYRPSHWRRERPHRSKNYAGEYVWFQPIDLIGEDAAYHPGSFLRSVLDIIYIYIGLAFVPAAAAVWQLALEPRTVAFAVAGAALTLFFGVAAVLKVRRLTGRRELLESGLLSIHSCAIMWQAVVVAHFRALDSTHDENGWPGYLAALSDQAATLRSDLFAIHAWIDGEGIRPGVPRPRRTQGEPANWPRRKKGRKQGKQRPADGK